MFVEELVKAEILNLTLAKSCKVTCNDPAKVAQVMMLMGGRKSVLLDFSFRMPDVASKHIVEVNPVTKDSSCMLDRFKALTIDKLSLMVR